MARKKTDDSTKTTGTKTSDPRILTPASFRSRRLRKRAERKLSRNKLPNSFKIFGRSIKMLAAHWEVFGGILLIYTLLNVVLVGGFSNTEDLGTVKDDLASVFTGQFSQLSTGLTLFTFLITSGTGAASGAASAYQTILIILVSLAVVWGLRQLYAGNKVRIRDTFYNSTYPLVQLLLVLLMICLQMIPALIGSFLLGTLVFGGILTVGWQQLLVVGISFLLIVWTAYLLCASLFAAYIVTLPDMTPLKALRSAKDIVRYRRGMILRKLLFLPVALLVLAGLVMVPLAALYTPAAAVVYFLMTMAAVIIVHSYMYTLYRELIQ